MSRKKVERNISYDDQRKVYYVNLDFGANPETGKQVKQTKTATKLTEARSILRQHEASRDKGLTVLPKSLTVAQWLNDWLTTVVVPNRAETTVYGYRSIIDTHIVPALGSIPLQKLTPQKIQQYYADKMGADNLSANSVRKHHDLLNSALKVAVRLDTLAVNPASKVVPPQKVQPEIHFYTPEELQQLLTLVEDTNLDIVVKLAGYFGLRREEILGLTWVNVDLTKRLIHICRARTTAGKKIVEKTTKTASSTRTLHIPDDVLTALNAERDKQQHYQEFLGDTYHNKGYVYARENGIPYSPNYVSTLFTEFIAKKNLPCITLHGLRHTFASVANSLGVPMFDIGKALGHSTPATTSRIYTHLFDQSHATTIDKIAGALCPSKEDAERE